MAKASGIRSKIASIKNTQKITRAMEMVAASKMRKTQEKMRASKPYAEKMYEVVKHVARSSSEYKHSFLQAREVQRVGFIIVTSDRGLCGGLNANLFRESVQRIRGYQEQGKEIALALVGRKAKSFFRRVGGTVLAAVDSLGDTPSVQSLVGVVKTMVDAYNEGQLDALYIVYNEFKNTMTQTPTCKQLLPLPISEEDVKSLGHRWDYIYEPEAKSLLDILFGRYIEVQVYQSVVENIACEQAAKMVAMKNATENASELIKKFQSAYNKARQAAITQELSEIVGGASAI
ncbi:MAG: F0F1 ATP synthase subunit gamma [Legionellaceae bacterium]|nr:F0F1 ATP synthase subunit gamma [Legionellaceae bacterium]